MNLLSIIEFSSCRLWYKSKFHYTIPSLVCLEPLLLGTCECVSGGRLTVALPLLPESLEDERRSWGWAISVYYICNFWIKSKR